MGKLVLRGFAQRRARALLTGIAIALGVALMAGTYILTDTINSTFAEVFGGAYKNKAVVVTQKETLGRRSGSETSPLTEALLARVRAVPGVAAASGAIVTHAALLTLEGRRLTSGGAPGYVDAVQPPRFSAFTAAKGHLPDAANQVAIDQATANREHLTLGQRILIAGRSPVRTYTIVGITRFAGSESFGDATVALLVPRQAQYVAGERREYDSIYAAAKAGVAPEQLATRVRAALPSTVTVRTGAQEAANQTSELEERLSFLRKFLLVFAYVALVVGAFIIFNTFSITVAQRTREFGLLRTLGCSRGQIMRSVVDEGLMLGVGGAVLGLAGGIGLAPALDDLFKAFGANLPDNGTVLEARTVIVSLAVGILVTVLAGLLPALRATRVPPVAAMREGVSIPSPPLTEGVVARRAGILLAVLVLLTVVLGRGVAPIAFVVFAVYVGAMVVRLARGNREGRHRVILALGRAVGSIVSWRGITGRLAEENSVRQPGRTLVTALALTVGLGLVAFISVLAAGTKKTIDQAVTRSFAGSLIIDNTQGTEVGIPAAIAPAVRRIEGVGAVTAIAFTRGRVRDLSQPGAPVIDEKSPITALEPESFSRMYRVEWEHGSSATLDALGQDGTVIKKKFASAHKLHVGGRLAVLTPSGRVVTLTVLGIVKEEVLGLFSNLTITRSLAVSAFGVREDGVDFVSYAPGAASSSQVDAAATRNSIDALLRRGFPQAHSQTEAEFTHEQSEKVNEFLLLVYVLLAMSVIVSLFGIVNTLILSIYERTHEIGLLRAIGASRRQIRQMIRYESLITSLIGGVLGLVIGVVGAVLVTELLLSGSGYVLSIPVGTLLLLLVVAALAGLLAAQIPARRAARMDVLSAVMSE